MASKPISRSMRFSEAVYDMIEQQAGDSFTAKFDALVTKCCWELPQKEKELQRIQEQIKQERQKLQKIQRKINEIDNLLFRMTATVQNFNRTTAEAMKALERMTEEQ